jgi:hypothetical protein
MSPPAIRERCGAGGVREYLGVDVDGEMRYGLVTDDTHLAEHWSTMIARAPCTRIRMIWSRSASGWRRSRRWRGRPVSGLMR